MAYSYLNIKGDADFKQVCIPFFDAQTFAFAELQGKTEKVFLLSCIEGL